MGPSAPKSVALRNLYWRSEILRVVYWLYGEGFGDVVDGALIVRFLGVDGHENLTHYLDALVDEGSLVRDGEWFALSARGRQEGEAQLATAFSELVPAHGGCDDECWCSMSPAEADACSALRTPPRPPPVAQAGKANA